ncbi:MAG: hypothetical protein U5N86_04415 [Planctomycetota bacterium]|nr:hypothetical protein [Planctomycetota bacterium]
MNAAFGIFNVENSVRSQNTTNTTDMYYASPPPRKHQVNSGVEALQPHSEEGLWPEEGDRLNSTSSGIRIYQCIINVGVPKRGPWMDRGSWMHYARLLLVVHLFILFSLISSLSHSDTSIQTSYPISAVGVDQDLEMECLDYVVEGAQRIYTPRQSDIATAFEIQLSPLIEETPQLLSDIEQSGATGLSLRFMDYFEWSRTPVFSKYMKTILNMPNISFIRLEMPVVPDELIEMLLNAPNLKHIAIDAGDNLLLHSCFPEALGVLKGPVNVRQTARLLSKPGLQSLAVFDVFDSDFRDDGKTVSLSDQLQFVSLAFREGKLDAANYLELDSLSRNTRLKLYGLGRDQQQFFEKLATSCKLTDITASSIDPANRVVLRSLERLSLDDTDPSGEVFADLLNMELPNVGELILRADFLRQVDSEKLSTPKDMPQRGHP